MSADEKRQALVDFIISREGKNQYTQSGKRDLVGEGYSDCSSLTRWVHQKALGIDIGEDTTGQILSDQLQTVELKIQDGVPEKSRLAPGDLLFFRGRDRNRDYAEYVGHVEMYVGDGQISGHGSGIGPVRKDMEEYCRMRQNSSSPVPAGNRGLICVRRAVRDTEDTGDGSGDIPKEETDTGGGRTIIRQIQAWINTYLSAEIKQGILKPLEIDGRGGPRTRKALVICLQKFHNLNYGTNLELDGSFGPATKRACRAVKRGRKDDLVRVCQAMLYIRGYEPNGFDGSCGGGCFRAIMAYQEDHDMTTDGSCGPNTFEAMFERNIRN